MAKNTKQRTTKPLRIIDSELFKYIVQELNERHNIHSYDMEILAEEKNAGLMIKCRYGEDYAHSKEAFFTFDAIKGPNSDFTTFIREVADNCKEVMVADYFRMMKP